MNQRSDVPSGNTPMAWFVFGLQFSVIGATAFGVIGETYLGYLGLFVSGIAGMCAFAGAAGYGVLLALRQHHRETGGI